MKPIISYLAKNQFVAALAILAVILLAIQIKDILVVIFISFILMAALQPAVRFLETKKLPRALAASIVYIVLIACILLLVVPIMPFFVSQVQNLIVNFPMYFEKAAGTLGFHIKYSNINSQAASLGSLGTSIFLITSTVFGGIVSFFTILVISFYLLLSHDHFEKLILEFFPREARLKTKEVFNEIEIKLGNWVRGQLILSLSVGLISYIFLQLLGVPYAFPLAFIAALFEAVPMIGPVLGSIPAIIVALTVSPSLAMAVTAGSFVIQGIENNVFYPKIMEKAVGLNPVVTIIAILVGGSLLGIWGALISIPFLTMVVLILIALND